jgi:hypothetical protein
VNRGYFYMKVRFDAGDPTLHGVQGQDDNKIAEWKS